MKAITPVELHLKNFRSFVDEIFTFPVSVGLKLLTGQNLVDAIGANGAGKSSLWESLVWCCYGYGIKGSKTASLVTWEELLTDVVFEFLVNDTKHTIHRFGPPMKVELDKKTTTQAEIDSLLGLSYERFLHSVIFGQGEKLFPDLPIPERANLFDQILDLSIWSKCTDTASKKVTAFEKLLGERKQQLMFLNGKLSSLETEEKIKEELDMFEATRKIEITNLQQTELLWEENHKLDLTSIQDNIKQWEEDHEKKIKEIQQQKQDWRDKLVKEAQQKLTQIEELEARLQPLQFEFDNFLEDTLTTQIEDAEKQLSDEEKKLDFEKKVSITASNVLSDYDVTLEFWNQNTCPTCGQPISENKRQEQLVFIKNRTADNKELLTKSEENIKILCLNITIIKSEIKEMRDVRSRVDEKKKGLKKQVDSLQSQIQTLEAEGQKIVDDLDGDKHPYISQMFHLSNEYNPYKEQKEKIEKQENPYTAQIRQVEQKVNPFIGRLDSVKIERKNLIQSIAVEQTNCKNVESLAIAAEYWKHGFKRIRLFFIEQILTTLQLEIKSAISSLGLTGWSIQLSTETETKSGTTRLGIQIKVKSPELEGDISVFSGGEAQRLRLGIAVGVASLIQRAAGVWYNLTVFDEPTQFLSQQGIEDLLSALEHWATTNKKAVWLLDHRSLDSTAFQEIWQVIKTEEGSKVYKVTGEN
jgi:DNA repair exonuclease SbcCD ATPase subunit